MKKILVMLCLVFATIAQAQVWVNPYTRSDGTYVPGYYRSAPDGQRWNNLGPATTPLQRTNPYGRDWDGDGLWNQYDIDDDNDGLFDDFDSNQYGR